MEVIKVLVSQDCCGGSVSEHSHALHSAAAVSTVSVTQPSALCLWIVQYLLMMIDVAWSLFFSFCCYIVVPYWILWQSAAFSNWRTLRSGFSHHNSSNPPGQKPSRWIVLTICFSYAFRDWGCHPWVFLWFSGSNMSKTWVRVPLVPGPPRGHQDAVNFPEYHCQLGPLASSTGNF